MYILIFKMKVLKGFKFFFLPLFLLSLVSVHSSPTQVSQGQIIMTENGNKPSDADPTTTEAATTEEVEVMSINFVDPRNGNDADYANPKENPYIGDKFTKPKGNDIEETNGEGDIIEEETRKAVNSDYADPKKNPYIGDKFIKPEGEDIEETNGEGDILNAFTGEEEENYNRQIVPPPKWPRATLWYIFDSNRTRQFSPNQIKRIRDSMNRINRMSQGCIQFLELTYEETQRFHYATFTRSKSGCSSYVGYIDYLSQSQRVDGGQPIMLSDNCFGDFNKPFFATPAHEIMHALGVQHEQVRPDSGNYVKIHENRINKTYFEVNFRKLDKREYYPGVLDLAYDFPSIMHYGQTAFLNETFEGKGLNTIDVLPQFVNGKNPSSSQSKNPGSKGTSSSKATIEIGQRNYITKIDIDRLMCIYDECKSLRSDDARKACG